MKVFLIALFVFGLALFGMSVGAIFGKRCFIKGSCGGLGGLRDEDGKPVCAACGSHVQPVEDQDQGGAS